MTASRRTFVVSVAVVAVAGLVVAAFLTLSKPHFPAPEWDPSLYAGWRAGITCSAVFIAGRPLSAVLVDELGGMPAKTYTLPDPVVDREARLVRAKFSEEEPPRLAVYRGGMGCSILPPGATVSDAAMLPRVDVPFPAGNPAEIPWPDGDLADPAASSAGVDPARLGPVVAAAFDGETYGEGTKTIGVVAVADGRIVAERYRPGFDAHTQYRTWSAAKSITNALIGILTGAGRIDVHAPAPIPEWGTGDPRARITVENLLHMSSGLEREGVEAYPAYFGGADTIREITSAPLEAEPGTRWHYANRDTLLLVRAARQVIGDDEAYWTFPRRALLNRIGMRDTIPETDAYGNFILSSQVWTTARDLARFALLYLHDGVWNDERILPQGWVEYSTTPAPGRSTGVMAFLRYGMAGALGYGAQFWLYSRVPFFPHDAYSAIGSRGQYATILPSQSLVVVRTGLDPEVGDVLWRQDRFVADVLKALSRG